MKILSVAFSLLLLLAFFQPALAQDSAYGIAFEKINPVDRGDYMVKRAKEKFKLFVISVKPKAKAAFYHELVQRRFSELVYVVESKDESQIERASNRYFTTVGQMAEYVEGKDWEIKNAMNETLESQIALLPNLIEKYPSESAGWLLLRQDLEYARQFKDRL